VAFFSPESCFFFCHNLDTNIIRNGLYGAYVGSYVGFEKELSKHHVCTSSSNQPLSQTRAVVVAVAVAITVTTVAVASGSGEGEGHDGGKGGGGHGCDNDRGSSNSSCGGSFGG
jgi:hypothetical protein